MMRVDAYTHFIPTRFYKEVMSEGGHKDIGKRMMGVPSIYDVKTRLKVVDKFKDYSQILSYPMPPFEMMTKNGKQAEEYAKILRTAFSHPAIEGFLFWGFWDARHWRPGAGLFDSDFKPKAAADSVYHLIHEVWTTSMTLRLDSLGQADFRGFYGTYDVRLRCSDGTDRTLPAKFLKNDPRTFEAVAE